jgi:hypothetical protein
VRFWHVFSQGVSHGSATVAFGSDRLVQRPATPRATLPIEIPPCQNAAGDREVMEKELKKLGEAIYWSAQKFNIWEFAAA